MPDVCTCGAVLPPDARFCHKCGKPQRDEPLIPPDVVLEATPPPPLPKAAAAAINFQNGDAVRSALLAGIIAFVGFLITSQFIQALALLWLAVAGLLSVQFYTRRTGAALSAGSGARLGGLCGIFAFVGVAVALAMTAVVLTDPQVAATFREQLQTRGIPAEAASQAVQIFHTPSGVAGVLALCFLMFTLLPAVGGAAGAKLFGNGAGWNNNGANRP